MRPNNKDPV